MLWWQLGGAVSEGGTWWVSSNILKPTLITGRDTFPCIICSCRYTEGPVWVWQVHFTVCWTSCSSVRTSVQHKVKMFSGRCSLLSVASKQLWELNLTASYVDTAQDNEQKSQFAVFAITLHLMMKHQGILCNKKQLRFIAAALCLIIPEGSSAFYLLYHKT